ncbi:MAG: P-II family nitrogen regulator, partial [Phormidesmis sp. CAN_BIN44]|nr:P-II family nitrogen regulator [Phormidesmis sp. CAN_BIN44]
GYTVIRNVAGRSLRGTVSDDFSSLDNVYVIAFCSTEQIDAVIENLNSILNKFGGVCFVSDAMRMNIVRCGGS